MQCRDLEREMREPREAGRLQSRTSWTLLSSPANTAFRVMLWVPLSVALQLLILFLPPYSPASQFSSDVGVQETKIQTEWSKEG